jgi:hypothetical protein
MITIAKIIAARVNDLLLHIIVTVAAKVRIRNKML